MSTTAVAAAPLQNTPKRKQQSISSIERADRRAELESRRQPHWKAVKSGRFIGYRFMSRGRPGTWLARMWLDGEKKYAHCSLGDFAELDEGKRYDAAVEKAKVFFEHHAMGGSTEATTVRQAGAAYVAKKLAEEGAPRSSRTATPLHAARRGARSRSRRPPASRKRARL
jgi:hypothetical protein